jgi:chaperonin cofactor prefoldin
MAHGEKVMAAVKVIVKQLNDTLKQNHTAYEARFAQLESQITDLEVELRDMQKAWHELARRINGGG